MLLLFPLLLSKTLLIMLQNHLRLFALSVEKDGSVFDFFQRNDGGDDWNFIFRRSLFAWEEGELQNLIGYLQGVPSLRTQAVDSCSWLAQPSGTFSVASVRSCF
ncbi:unnamed protein product [Camellia sinensis]